MNKKVMTVLYVAMMIAVIFACGFIVYYYFSNGQRCLENPLKYYEEKIGDNVKCMCINFGKIEND